MIRNFRDGDIATSGRQFLIGKEEVGQAVRARLRLFLGEYFLDVSNGTNWFGRILGKAPQDVAEITLKQRIITTPGVAQLRRFVFDPDLVNRRIRIRMTVATTAGEETDVSIDEVLI